MEKAEEGWLECARGQRQTPAWFCTMLVSVLVEGSLHCDGVHQSGLCVLVLRSQERVDMPLFTALSWWTPSLLCEVDLKQLIISAWKCCFHHIVSVHPCISHCLSNLFPWCGAGIAFNLWESICPVTHAGMTEDASDSGCQFLLMVRRTRH